MLFYMCRLTATLNNPVEDASANIIDQCRKIKFLPTARDIKPLFLMANVVDVSLDENMQNLHVDFGLVLHHKQVDFEALRKCFVLSLSRTIGPVKIMFFYKEVTSEKLKALMSSNVSATGRLSALTRCNFRPYGPKAWDATEALYSKEPISKVDAMTKAKLLLADKSVFEEIERIYDSINSQSFLGHPVHYHIRAHNQKAAEEMVLLLLQALHSNNRLISTRYSTISNIRPFWDENNMNFFSCTDGSAVVVQPFGEEGKGSSAEPYEQVAQGIYHCFKKKAKNTLFIFVELIDKPSCNKSLYEKISPEYPLVVLEEGYSSAAMTRLLLASMANKADMGKYWQARPLALEERKYSYSEALKLYEQWEKNIIMTSYMAYADLRKTVGQKPIAAVGEAYQRLQRLVGLKNIKQLVDEMLAVHKINSERASRNIDCVKNSAHMIFTGNPGSAKTTVARLLAKILAEEGLITSGKLVECGRSDLVGKYVGWTANMVKSKFQEAKGGILFVDEAYALVDGPNSYGVEAINTIVQEMENNRDSVIVIFAGYPQKMQEFLNQNEGLRSRISFHLDFPDYTPEELMQIFQLLAEEKGFKLEKNTLVKTEAFFQQAVKKPDFGNGRFARNLLEKALLKQSLRLATCLGQETLSDQALVTLTPEDIEVEIPEFTPVVKPMGFVLD